MSRCAIRRFPKSSRCRSSAADSALRRSGFAPEVSREQYSARVGAGAVIFQFPLPGRREKTGSIVDVVVSEGPNPTAVPSLGGMTEAGASAALLRAHLVGRFSRSYSETVTAGKVIQWTSPDGTRVFYGDKVDVVISEGPAPQTLPLDLKGGQLNWTQAASALADLHLTPTRQGEYTTLIRPGQVITTKPAPGATVPGHSQVLVYVSLGPPFVKVPSLQADSVSVAEQKLSSLGLKWQLYGPPGARFVLNEVPGADAYVRTGDTILVYLF